MTIDRSRRTWGSADEIEALYAASLDALRQLCRSFLGDTPEAEDAAHEAFKRTIERSASVGFQRQPRRFLFGEARRVCLAQLDDSRREGAALRTVMAVQVDPALLGDESVEAGQYLGLLTPAQKSVLAHIYAGYELKEIARKVDRPIGTVASRLGQIRDRARKVNDRLGALILTGGTRMLLRRKRIDVPALAPSSFAAAATVAGLLVAGGLPWAAQSRPAPLVRHADAAAADMQTLSTSSVTLRRGPAAAVRIVPLPASAKAEGTNSSGTPPRRGLGGLTLPSDETPEDSDVRAVSPSPDYAHDHTVVAIGLGHACGCPVLFRSTDGAASWTASLDAVAGTQVLLAPNYPADSRIFIGQAPGSIAPDWVSPGWGQPFSPLPTPSGPMAIVGNRVLVAANTGVWSIDGAAVTPLITYQGVGAAALASTTGTAYILAPAHAVGPGPTITTGPSLFACTARSCGFVGAVPIPQVGLLVASGRVVAATGLGRVVVSSDGGATFVDITPATTGASIEAMSTSGVMIWSVIQAVSGSTVLRRDAGVWSHVMVPGAAGVVLNLSETRVLALLTTGGTLCSENAGGSWQQKCSPD